jgi:hypothetical protein
MGDLAMSRIPITQRRRDEETEDRRLHLATFAPLIWDWFFFFCLATFFSFSFDILGGIGSGFLICFVDIWNMIPIYSGGGGQVM